MHEVSTKNTTSTERPKAYSYVRFSTPEQERGDSHRRQTEAAQRYCESRGLELDTELRFDDRGVSAFKGRNAVTGALAAFKQAVADGTVAQGSYLLVESLDRISRQTPRKAARTLEDIVEAGVSVVDLSDHGRVYDSNTLDDPFAFILMVLQSTRAYEESAKKSMRVASAYEQKREVAASGSLQLKPFTRMLPGWLHWNDDSKRHEVIEERADILRDIFARADAGWSKHRIARALNEVGIEPWGLGKRKGKHWHSSYIQKLLTNSAVIGTFTPHKVLRTDGGTRKRTPQDAIENYFPSVVDRDVFGRVSAQAKARAARGRHVDTPPKSIFSGLIRCARCGGSVVRVAKGQYSYLVCAEAHQRAGCKYLAVRYENAEEPFVHRLRFVGDWAPRGTDTAQIEAEIERLAQNIEAGQNIAEELLDEAVTEKSETARRRLKAVEEELAGYEGQLQALRSQREAKSSQTVMRRLTAIQDEATRRPLVIRDLNKALRQAVSKIVFDPEEGELIVWWHHADVPSDPVSFLSRHDKRFNDALDLTPEA